MNVELSNRARKADFSFKIKTKPGKGTCVSGFQAVSVFSVIEKGLHKKRAEKVHQFSKCGVGKELTNLLGISWYMTSSV